MKKFEELTDNELLDLNMELSSIDDYIEKLEYAAKTLLIVDIASRNSRTINNKHTILDLTPNTKEESQLFGDWYVPKYKDEYLQELLQRFQQRLNNKPNDHKRKTLIEAELKTITPEVHRNGDIRSGYEAEELSRQIKFVFSPKPYVGNDYKGIAIGAALYNYKVALNDMLLEVDEEVVPSGYEPSKVIRFTVMQHKLLLLQKLGVFRKFNDLKLINPQKAYIICGLLGITEEKQIKTIFRAVSHVGLPRGMPRSFDTEKARTTIDAELSKVGISLEDIEKLGE